MSDHVHGRGRRVLDDVARFGHPYLPLPTEPPRGTEQYSREHQRNIALSRRRLDEMADRLCMPTAYLAAILANLEDHGVIDWRTGEITSKGTTT